MLEIKAISEVFIQGEKNRLDSDGCALFHLVLKFSKHQQDENHQLIPSGLCISLQK